MKRFITSLLALPLIVAFAVSCDRNELEEEESVTIEGLAETIEFTAVPTGDVTFSITSNVEWSISMENLDWVSISPSRGLGRNETTVVTITPDVNKDFESRQGTFVLRAGSVSRTVTLTQAAGEADPVFNLSGTEGDAFYIEALNVEGSVFNVSSNRDWTATLDGMSWATVSPLEGVKDRSATITVVPKAINEGDDKEGTISFDYGAAAPKVVKIVHKKFVPEVSLSVSELSASSIGTISDPKVVVTSNAPWTATCSEEWVTVDKKEGEIGETEVTVSVKGNNTGSERSATVTFTNSTATAVLTVNQSNEFITTSVESLATSKNEVTFDVNANVDWTVVSSESWASVSPEEGTGNATVTITLSPLMPGAGSRQAQITVAAKNSEGLSAVIELTQNEPVLLNFIDLYETPVLFNCSQQSWNVANNAEYISPGSTGSTADSKGTGRAQSYSHLDNKDLYMQYYDAPTGGFGSELKFIMPADGAYTANYTWTDDAFEFHIPVKKLDYGTTITFEYGLAQGGSNAPRIWNSEISLDGGTTWESFDTGNTETSPNNGQTGNSVLMSGNKKPNHYKGTYQMQQGVQDLEVIIRVRSVDASHVWTGSATKTVSKPQGTSMRLIGGTDHPWVEKVEEAVAYGPKISVSNEGGGFVPELAVSSNTLRAEGTSVSFDVTSNVAWTASSADSWATVSPAEGTGNAAVTVTFTELAPGADNRTTTITVSAKEYAGYTQTIILEQIAPAPAGPEGNYIDLASTPVLFNACDQAWNIANNPDYATAGQTGAKPAGDPGQGSGKGTGKLQSYSHYSNPDLYIQYVASPRAEGHSAPAFIMPANGITVKQTWTDDAFEIHLPVWKITAGQALHFDFLIYCKGVTSPRHYAVEASFDGGETWSMFDTGATYTTVSGAAANVDLLANESYTPVEAKFVVNNEVSNSEVLVRIRIPDATHTVSTKEQPHGTAPGAGAIRLLGLNQTNVNGTYSESGPKIYVK